MSRRIGDFLRDLGVLSDEQVSEILHHSRATGSKFGETALRLGILKSEMPLQLYQQSGTVDFFHLKPEYFPTTTKDLLTVDEILRFGVLPLGYKAAMHWFKKGRDLNMGFLDPTRESEMQSLENLIRQKGGESFDRLKPYLILVDQFLEILETVYKCPEHQIREHKRESLSPALHMYLELVSVNPS